MNQEDEHILAKSCQLEEFYYKKRRVKKCWKDFSQRFSSSSHTTVRQPHCCICRPGRCSLVKVNVNSEPERPMPEDVRSIKGESFSLPLPVLNYVPRKLVSQLCHCHHHWSWTRTFLMILYSLLFLIACDLVLNTVRFVDCYGMDNMSPRVVLTKQAQFQGFLGPKNVRPSPGGPGYAGSGYHPDPYNYRTYGHPVVEIFKGIPYASPPLNSLRYESPVPFPLKSNEVYSANVTKPACPRFVNASVATPGDGGVDSLRTIRKLQQLEDCLYLDIYAPLNTKKSPGSGLPVLVYANSQPDDPNDPFDASSIAAIGQIIVVTFRYRVGVVGFLQPSYFTEDVRSNFGLWDMLAALQWIKENIVYFGGDENNVSLMGNDLDATLVGVLALSPLSQAYGGLFRRLILLNGSPFSPISINHRPLDTTVRLAKALQCPLHERSTELMTCLRRKPITHLLTGAHSIGSQILSNQFGPSVDGTIVKQELGSLTTVNHQFPNILDILSRYDILCGLGEGPVLPNIGKSVQFWQNLDLEKFVTAAIKLALDMDFGTEPTFNLKQEVIRAIKNEYGDYPLMRDLVSDFLMITPMIQLLNKHSETGRNTYFYVSKNYDPLHKGKHSEIPYIFSSEIYGWKYVNADKHKPMDLHPFEAMISLIANFVQSGDPNRRDLKDTLLNPEKSWPRYRRDQGRYLKFGRHVDLVSKYRHSQVIFWSHVFPNILKPFLPGGLNQDDVNGDGTSQFPTHFGQNLNHYFNSNNVAHIYPTGNVIDSASTTLSGITGNTVFIIGGLLLVLNILCFMGICYQRQRLKRAETRLRKDYNLHLRESGENVKDENDDIIAAGPTVFQDDVNSKRKKMTKKRDRDGVNYLDGDHERMLELDSTESEPYQIAHHRPPQPGTHQQSTFSAPQQQRLLVLQHPISDALSETETDNGFGPNFLGPNYDPKTKVSRWMFQQTTPDNVINGSTSKGSRPSPPPMEIESMMGSGRQEPMYTCTNPHMHHHHPFHATIPQPVHIHINTNTRQLPTPPIHSGSMTTYHQPQQPAQQHPHAYQPINTPGSDIPYADSRATSPSVSGFNGMPQRQSYPLNNNLSSTDYNNSSLRRVQAQFSRDSSGMSPVNNDYEVVPSSNTNSIKRNSVVAATPLRNSIIIRELEPNTDEVESSEPRVQVKSGTGTLKRSVGVGSNGNLQKSIDSGINEGTGNPGSSSRVAQGQTGASVVQKVTFADGL